MAMDSPAVGDLNRPCRKANNRSSPGANLWILHFSLHPTRHFLVSVAHQLAVRDAVMNLVYDYRKCIHLGGVGPPIYAQVMHFENTENK